MELLEKLEYGVKLDALLEYKGISGAGAGEKSLFLAGLGRPFIYLCTDFALASKIKKQLSALGLKTGIISSGIEALLGNTYRKENFYPILSELFAFLSGELSALIVLPHVAISPLPIGLGEKKIELKNDSHASLKDTIRKLAEFGYSRVEAVDSPMQFALRGDILDIFPITEKEPLRLSFFDDYIEKITYFDPSTMKNGEKIEKINVFSCQIPESSDKASCILDYSDTIVVDEPKRISDEISMLIKSSSEQNFFLPEDRVMSRERFCFSMSGEKEIKTLSKINYSNDYKALFADIERNIQVGIKTVLFMGDEFSKERMKNFLTENSVAYIDFDLDVEKGKVAVSREYLPLSATFLDAGIMYVGTDDLVKPKHREAYKNKQDVFYLPKVGDHVVHSFHGIGKCVRVEKMKMSDYEKDYFVIEYAGGSTLYLPGEQANLITAYLGGEGSPKLNTLGGGEFSRIKARVKAGLEDMAGELVKLYKQRETAKGFVYLEDSYLEKEFDEAFEFDETPDQLDAIADIKKDMEAGKVMDRLICGDVGYGKTEVALRAVYKAVTNGKQVAFLCPTTILSEQHYKTIKKRMAEFMVKAEVLNRFKTTAQAKAILEKVKKGELDVLIGTHRILKSDVVFKDLGLLVLDEEQRFGVKDKEAIKQLKKEVGVISLSATPIPRTLHMSLSGIRDISLLTTAPKERMPIQTYVADYSDELLSDVITREISRGGIIFIVYNRVESIYTFASHVKNLRPDAKIGVAHGQMAERELEAVIERLYNGEYNILIATTIIENGIDLPLANSLFIIDSDKLGLAQLYQLRGRVGRSNRLAYAYLTYDGRKVLTEEAYKRLDAINEYRELGSGFKIAMRDLEIRGAGNVLGKQQHGHLEKVGYDMYVKLLEEVVMEKRSGKLNEQREIKMDVALSAFLSEDYISAEDERIKTYRNISDLSSREELEGLVLTLTEAFGVVPFETLNLMKIALVKNIASGFGVKRVIISVGRCDLELYKTENIIDERLRAAMSKTDASLKIGALPIISLNVGGVSCAKVLEKLIVFLGLALDF